MLLQRTVQAVQVSQLVSSQHPSLILLKSFRNVQRTVILPKCRNFTHSSKTSSSSHSSPHQYWLIGTLSILGTSVLFLDKSALQLEAPQSIEKEREPFRLDPSTSQPFPFTLPTPLTPLPSQCNKLTLVGLGVRTVSFLRVKVYVAGLYIDTNALNNLNKVEGWAGFEQAWMTDSKGKHSGEELLAALLDQGVAFAIRIVPVRPTDYGHLRDGFTRAIQGRAKLARKQGQLTDSADEALSLALQDLKEAFPRTSLPKGQALDLIFAPSRSGSGYDLALEEGGKVLGRINSPSGATESRFSVARQLFLAYFADQNEISKPFKESVAQGFEQAIRR